tara:strand:+ start:1113 stop:1295 length:183 start_codon:yes stop_codon:yes gene_type:complete
MKIGDLVKTVLGPYRRGFIIEQVQDRLALKNKVFRVLWLDGSVGNNIWDYDLELVNNENR